MGRRGGLVLVCFSCSCGIYPIGQRSCSHRKSTHFDCVCGKGIAGSGAESYRRFGVCGEECTLCLDLGEESVLANSSIRHQLALLSTAAAGRLIVIVL